MNVIDYVDLRKSGRGALEIEVDAVLWRAGLVGKLWGAKILISRNVKPRCPCVQYDTGTVTWCDEHEQFCCNEPACVVSEVHLS
jgi:hypothetical protein